MKFTVRLHFHDWNRHIHNNKPIANVCIIKFVRSQKIISMTLLQRNLILKCLEKRVSKFLTVSCDTVESLLRFYDKMLTLTEKLETHWKQYQEDKQINYNKPFAYPCMVTLAVFDILVILEISGTLNIKGRSAIKKNKSFLIPVLQK